MDVVFVGHPLKDTVRTSISRKDFFQNTGLDGGKPLLGLLPGSRVQEVRHLLPEMIEAYKRLRADMPGLQAVLGMAPNLSDQVYLPCLPGGGEIRSVRSQAYEVMAYSDAVLVASGTATLETALTGTPMVILYKMSAGSFLMGRLLVHMENIGLANIVAGKRIVPELLQNDVTGEKIRAAALPLLTDRRLRERTRRNLNEAAEKLGKPGATERAAGCILEFLSSGRGA
jgi:lipid-A-disaccharide synthase